MIKANEHEMLYFGVWQPPHTGHYLYAPNGDRYHEPYAGLPFRPTNFDRLIRLNSQGRAAHFKMCGYSIVWICDSSGDPRAGSNSVFFAKGDYSSGEVIAMAERLFPTQMNRITLASKIRFIPFSEAF